MRKRILRYLLWSVFPLGLAVWFSWPWLSCLSGRFGPLTTYRVYELPADAPWWVDSSDVWREPRTRWELLLTPDYLVRYPERPRPPRRVYKRRIPEEPTWTEVFTPDDDLSKFVVEDNGWYVRPATHTELEAANERGTAFRASTYFTRHFGKVKPYAGDIPPWLCGGSGGWASGIQPLRNSFELRSGTEWVARQMPAPTTPQARIVSAFSPEDARRAAFLEEPPISYDKRPFYAAICAGLSQSSPAEFVVERVVIDRRVAIVVLSRPKKFVVTRDVVPNWFYVPLGLLPAGDFEVEVRELEKNEPLVVTKATLRYATAEEEQMRQEQGEMEQAKLSIATASTKCDYEDAGAALHVRQQRLAVVLQTYVDEETDITSAHADLAALGGAVDWSRELYARHRVPRQSLAPPWMGEPQSERLFPSGLKRSDWRPADVSLADVWLCDGTDAPWYAERHLKKIPEFADAITTPTPTDSQVLIRDIWTTLTERFADPQRPRVLSVCASGAPQDVLRAAHAAVLAPPQGPTTLPSDKPAWLAMFARRSFLPLAVWQRERRDPYAKTTSREFLIETSAYIRQADEPDGVAAPATFALIPLGIPGKIDHVVAFPRCRSVCGRGEIAAAGSLVEALPPEQLLQAFQGRHVNGGGFRVERVTSEAE